MFLLSHRYDHNHDRSPRKTNIFPNKERKYEIKMFSHLAPFQLFIFFAVGAIFFFCCQYVG